MRVQTFHLRGRCLRDGCWEVKTVTGLRDDSVLACAAAGAKTQRSRPRQQPSYLGLDPRAPPGIWRPALPSQKETTAVEGMLALETECPPFEP